MTELTVDSMPRDERADPAEGITREVLDRLFARRRRHFAVRLWNGRVLPAETPAAAPFTLVLEHPGALRSMFWPPGQVSLTTAFLGEEFDVEGDIVAAMGLVDVVDALGPLDWLAISRAVLALPERAVRTGGDRDGLRASRRPGLLHSLRRDRAAVGYHYNVGNDFYALFLGKWMAYSCAYFERPDADLDTAQEAKLDHICRKLRLSPGEHLLDIGCGWGGLVVHAAQRYGVRATGITLSEPQAEHAREWAKRAGVADRVRIELRDYRELDGRERYDKIASVGMFEHVGRPKMDGYFRAVHAALREGGLFLNHAISDQYTRPSGLVRRVLLQQGQFVQRYVFPDGEVITLGETLSAAERVGFEARDVEGMREHYALTMRRWLANLAARHDEAVRLKGEWTYRIWRMYIGGFAEAFEVGECNLFQTVLSKSRPGRCELPLTRGHLYPRPS